MYVCICNAITERQIQAAVQQGLRSMAELESRLLVSTSCGSCREHAEECLRKAIEITERQLVVAS